MIICQNNPKQTHPKSLMLNKLLHVPAITKNLLSVSQFARDNHVFFEFHSDFCCVKHQDTKEIILQGIVDNGLYKFSSSSFKQAPSPTAFLSSTKGDSSFHLWHNRHGHLSPTVVSKVLKSCNLPFSVDSHFVLAV